MRGMLFVPGQSAALRSLLRAGLRFDGAPAVYCSDRRASRLRAATCRRTSRSCDRAGDGRASRRRPIRLRHSGPRSSRHGAATRPTRSRWPRSDTDMESSAKARCHVRDGDRPGHRASGPRRGSRPAIPDHGLVGEEYGADASGSSRRARWNIDPIDGTHNFMRGVPIFATLVAVERDGTLAARRRQRAGPAPPLVRHGVTGARGRSTHGGRARAPRSVLASRRIGEIAAGVLVAAIAARVWAAAGLRSPSRTRRGASAGSATSGATCWWPRAPRRRCSRSASSRGTSPRRCSSSRRPAGAARTWTGIARVDGAAHVSSNGRIHDELLRTLRG